MCKYKIFFTVVLGLLLSSLSLSPAQAQSVDAIISPEEAEIEVGENLQFETFAFSLVGESRTPVEVDKMEWSVLPDSSVAPDSMGTITGDGFFVAGRHKGVAIIRVVIHIGPKRIIKKVAIRIGKVFKPFFGVQVVPEKAVVPVGGEKQYSVVVTRGNIEVPPKFVRWEVIPAELGKIDEDGLFTAGADKGYGKVIAHVEVDGLKFRAKGHVIVSPPATAAISGNVVSDGDGLALSGAVVKAVRLGRVHWAKRGETDENGNYQLGGLIPGVYVVRANAQAHIMEFYDDTRNYLEATPLNIAVGDTNTDINFSLSEGGKITGTVLTDSDSMPLPGIHVAAVLAVNHGIARHTITGEDGSYMLEALPSGSYFVAANGTGYKAEYYEDVRFRSQATLVPVTEPDTTSGIDFSLGDASAIKGVVTSEADGTPIAGAQVLVFGSPDVSLTKKRVLRETRTNEAGEYVLQIRPGSYILRASARGFNSEFFDGQTNRSTADVVVVAADSHSTGIDFSLSSRSTIAGTVTAQATGLPLAGAIVEAFKESANLDAASTKAGFRARTDSLGQYLIEDVPAGKFIVVSRAPGYLHEFYNEQTLKIDADILQVIADTTIDGIDFTLEHGGSISGMVATEEDSTPVAKALVRVFDSNSDRHIVTYTNRDGEYKIGGLPTGSYQVQVMARDFFPEFYDNARKRADATLVDVTVPDETPDIDFYLTKHVDKEGTIAGRVVSQEDESPLHGAVVVAVSPGKRVPHLTFTGPEGYYRITDLPPGRYYVFAWDEGFVGEFFRNAKLFKNADVVIVGRNRPTDGIDFALKPIESRGLYAIRGRIQSTNQNRPIEGILVHARLDDDVLVNAVTDANGDFVLSGLAAGEYKVEATGAGYTDTYFGGSSSNTAADVDVGNGEDATSVNLEMENDNITDVDGSEALPEVFSLEPNFPNPFNPETTIKYHLAAKANVTLKIFNILGQQVRTLVEKSQVSGSYAVQWDGKDAFDRQVASGIYIFQIDAGDQFRMSRRMMLLK